MDTNELLTRGTIWLALCCSVVGAASDRLGLKLPQWQSAARWAWSAACFFYLLHVISAFHYYHDWSHVTAYHETARQTAEVFGIDSGGGLFVNYAFTAIWVADTIWRWMPTSYKRWPRFLSIAWRGIFLLLVFSATVVFEVGLTRWVGLALSAALASLWWSPSSNSP